jgi:hypothetical protein
MKKLLLPRMGACKEGTEILLIIFVKSLIIFIKKREYEKAFSSLPDFPTAISAPESPNLPSVG